MIVAIVKWPNGDETLVWGKTKKDIFWTLDELGDPTSAEITQIQSDGFLAKMNAKELDEINFINYEDNLHESIDLVSEIGSLPTET